MEAHNFLRSHSSAKRDGEIGWQPPPRPAADLPGLHHTGLPSAARWHIANGLGKEKKKNQLLFIMWINNARERCVKGTKQNVFVLHGLFCVDREISCAGLGEDFLLLFIC